MVLGAMEIHPTKKSLPGDSKWPVHPLFGGHLTIEKGHVFTIPKRSPAELPGSWWFMWLNQPILKKYAQSSNWIISTNKDENKRYVFEFTTWKCRMCPYYTPENLI